MKTPIILCSILFCSLASFAQVNNPIDDFFKLEKGDSLFIDVYQECSRALGKGYRLIILKESDSSQSLDFIRIEDFGRTYAIDGKVLSEKEKLESFLSTPSDKVTRGKLSLDQLKSIREQLAHVVETKNEDGGLSYHCDNFLKLKLNTLSLKEQFKYAIKELPL